MNSYTYIKIYSQPAKKRSLQAKECVIEIGKCEKTVMKVSYLSLERELIILSSCLASTKHKITLISEINTSA